MGGRRMYGRMQARPPIHSVESDHRAQHPLANAKFIASWNDAMKPSILRLRVRLAPHRTRAHLWDALEFRQCFWMACTRRRSSMLAEARRIDRVEP